MADNIKALRVLSIIQIVFGSLLLILCIVMMIMGGLPSSYIIDIILAVTILVAGGLGIGATSPSRLNGPGRGLVTGCMVLSIIAASVALLGFVLNLLTVAIYAEYIAVVIIVAVVLLFLAGELVLSIWSAVCCARMGACGCCPQNQVPGQVVYVANQGGAVPIQGGYVVVQGPPTGTTGTVLSQAYPVPTANMAAQPMQAQGGTYYPPPYPGEEARNTETKVPL